jgi:hypothetical protein
MPVHRLNERAGIPQAAKRGEMFLLVLTIVSQRDFSKHIVGDVL